MTTDWKYRIYLFVRAVDATAENRTAFAQIYVDNGGMETLINELKVFDHIARFSISGEEPAQVYGISTTAKLAMRDAFKNLLDSLTDARYAITANTDLPGCGDNGLILTNFPGIIPSGQIVTWETALIYLASEFGLQRILPDVIDA